MAEQQTPPENEDDELLLTEEVEEGGDDHADDEDEHGSDDEDGGEGEEEEVLTFGDDLTEVKADDSSTIKALRDELKRARKEAREARESTTKPEPVEVGEKPTLEGCDFDEEKFEAELDAWKDRKNQAERQKTQATEAQRKEAEAWAAEVKHYKDDLSSLGYADADDAEETVASVLNEVQQAVLVKAADRPGRLLYALSKNPERLAQLAAISDPLKFAAAVARQEGQLKVTKKRKAPDPEVIERGGGKMNSGSIAKELEKLQKEADRTGERTKLQRFKKKHGIK